MKRNFKLLALLLSAVLLAGCSPDDDGPEGQQGEEQQGGQQGENQPDFLLTVTPDDFSFDGLEYITQDDDTKFVVKNLMSSEVTITVESSAQMWLKIAKQGEIASASLTVSANTEMDVYLSLKLNDTGLPRQGTISVTRDSSVKKIVVKQGFVEIASPDAFSFSGTSHTMQGESTKFTVPPLPNKEVSVTVESSAQTWLKIAKQGETASTSLTVPADTEMDIYLSLMHNNTGSPRQGKVVVTYGTSVKEIVVKQAFNNYSYKVGDHYPDPDAAIGIVFWLDTTAQGYNAATQSGPSGKIVSLDEPSNSLSWGPWVGAAGGATSYFDGRDNMVAVKSIDNTFSDYPAFAWVDQKNGVAGATTYASGAKGIWYLPAVAELQYLLCAAAGQPYETWRFSGSDNDSSYCPSFNPISWSRVDLSGFNAQLTSAGGVAFIADRYWSSIDNTAARYRSSTGDAPNGAWVVHFGDGSTSSHWEIHGYWVRCVMEF